MKSILISRLAFAGLFLSLVQPVTATDLADIYDLAVHNDPQLAAARASYMATRETVPQARAGLLPNFSVGGTTSRTERTVVALDLTDKFSDHSWQVVLQQPVFRLENWYQFQQSKNIEAQALAQFTAEQQEMIFRVADSYLSILEANDQLSATNAERDAVKRQLEQVQQRFDVGLVAITDVLESTAAYDSSTVNVIESEGLQVITFVTLLRLTGQSFDSIDALDPDFPIEYPEPNDEEAWVQRALASNYILVAAREGVKAAERNLSASKSRHLPTLDAQISYAENVSDAQLNPISAEIEQKSAALLLNIPLYAGGSIRSRSKQAGYQLQEAMENYDLAQRTTVENTRTLFTAINTDVARVGARLRGIESSQSALEATQTGYEVGTRNIVDVLLAQQRLYLAQFQYASARYQYIRDTLRLKQTVGSLSPQDVYDLNKFITQDRTVDRITPTTR
ncbi:MAG: TolC family outer membrane protein [bacterium]